jgi:hypothetical protein
MKTFLVVSLAFLLCACVLGAETAFESRDDFLASLGSPEPVLEKAAGFAKSSCTVTLTCDAGGYFLSCTSGSGACSSTATSVTCDGVTQTCPVCYRTRTCCDNSVIECFGWSSCSAGPPRCVTCDGVTQDCCPPLSSCF